MSPSAPVGAALGKRSHFGDRCLGVVEVAFGGEGLGIVVANFHQAWNTEGHGEFEKLGFT